MRPHLTNAKWSQSHRDDTRTSAQDCKPCIYVLSFLNKGHVAKATGVIHDEEVGYLNHCCENTLAKKIMITLMFPR